MTPSALNSLASSLGISPDMLRTLGVGAAGLYGAYTANQSANSMMDLANQYKDFGAEYRARLSALYANPNSFLTSQEVQGPTQLATQGVMRSLSTKVGNPWGNPAALQEAQDYTAMNLFNRLGSEKDRLGTLGGLGAGNAAAPQLAAQAIQAQRGPGDVIGATVGSLLNPPRSVSSYFGLA